MIDKNKYVVLDGAMGTALTKLGLKPGEIGEFWNIDHPEKVIQVHKSYINAGADIIYTNTFGISRKKLEGKKYSTSELLKAGVKNAQIARGNEDIKIALSIGSIGEMMEPMGTLKFDECYELYKEQVVLGEEAGADLIVLETITDLYEMKAAILATKENTNLPVISSMSFEENGRTFNGCLPESFAITATGLGVDVLGINCSLGPFEIYPLIERISKVTNLPLIVKANAGLPDFDGDYTMESGDFVQGMEKIAQLGVQYLGGCCGTDDEYIQKLSNLVSNKFVPERATIEISAICSPTQFLKLEGFVGVGERINPTGRKDLKTALERGDYNPIVKEALLQSEGYCQILDINVGTPGVDEINAMTTAVKKVQEAIDLPLQIDSSDLEAIEAGLRYYSGKAIVNSVSGEKDKMDKFFPIIKKYGAAFIGLALDEDGIPSTAKGRLEVARKIVDTALSYGIPKEDIVIDTLALTLSTDDNSALISLETIELIKEELGVKTIMGVSNISFGLPNRDQINSMFLTMAIDRGLDLGIINPISPKTQDGLDTYFLIKGLDPVAENYIENQQVEKQTKTIKTKNLTVTDCLFKGLEKELEEIVSDLLEKKTSIEIMNKELIPSLDKVGLAYENGEIFLPQLIKAASTAGVGFDILKASLPEDSEGEISKGQILLATVEGDIHDIGKNIAKVILENYGYDVIDLGRDVPVDVVVEEVKKRNIQLVGLSALMTTTLVSMEKTIQKIKEYDPTVKIMVGGAVLTEEYAIKIGADYYVRDAQEDVAVAKEVFEEVENERSQ